MDDYSFFIGGVKIEHPFVLAPLAGITNWPFRKLAKEAGAALTVTEMVSSVALSFRGKATLQLLKTDLAIEQPFCVQLFGKDPERMAIAASIAAEKGANIIDLNFACPARKVINSGNGAALLKDFKLIEQILKAVTKAVDIPVTVKTRAGFAPNVGSVFDLLPILENEGVSALILHPRYASDGFAGTANWELLGKLAAKATIPVIGSGDVVTAEDAIFRFKNYPVKGVMIGRAAKGQSWIFSQCKALLDGKPKPVIGIDERINQAIMHASFLAESMETKAPFMLRSILMWYTKGLPGSTKFRARICQEDDIQVQISLLKELGETVKKELGDSPLDSLDEV